MNSWRFLLVALCTLALAGTASAASPTDTPAAASYCNKLCIIGYHCVPTPSGGRCVPGPGIADTISTASTQARETTAAASYCNKLCIIGYHCVPTPTGGRCVPGKGVADADLAPAEDSADMPPVTCDENAANFDTGEVEANPRPECGPCTILCPIGTHLVQTGNCDCKCVGNAG
jgi:hypothetical protein